MKESITTNLIYISIRSILSLSVLFVLTRFMGKKQISQLNFFDYIVGITIGSIAAELSTNSNIPIIPEIVSLVIWGVFPILLSYITLKNMNLRRKLEGTSTVLIENGIILEKNLKKEKFHLNDLLEELRMNGAFNIFDVQYAILETNGKVSVLLKPDKQAITPGVMNIHVPKQALAANLIIDGKVMKNHLDALGLNIDWLMYELHKSKINSIQDILLAVLDSENKINYYFKNNKNSSNILD